MKRKDIAIIGGGIAGLTFAICMKNKGYKCHLFEKNAEFKEAGAAISMFPNALRVFQELGLLAEIIASAGEMTKLYLKADKGKNLAKSEPKYELPTICIHRANLHQILLKHSNASLHSDHELTEVVALPDGKAKVSFNNGATHTFDAVIGADGIYSVVRQMIIGDGQPVFRGYNIWRGVVKSDFEVGYGSETYGKGQRVGIVPIKDGHYGWWATCNENFMQGDKPEGSKQKLLRLFGDWHYPIPELIAHTDVILKNGAVDRKPVKGWTRGNVTLVGDAAHPTTPNLGQGGCIAIEGAYILAKAIDKYGLTEKAFQRYEELQFPRAKSVVESSRQLGKVGQIANSMAVFFRNLFFQLTPAKVALHMVDKFFSYDVRKLEV